jgi:response regulator NasT
MTIKTVIASQSIESRTLLENVLRSSEFETVFVGSSLKKLLVETSLNTPELIVISIDTADSHLLEQLQIIHQQYPLPIVIFAQDDSDDAIDKFIKAGVSAYVVDGLISMFSIVITPLTLITVMRFGI